MAGNKNKASAGNMHGKDRDRLISGIEKKIIKSKDYRTSVKLADTDEGKSAASAAAIAAVECCIKLNICIVSDYSILCRQSSFCQCICHTIRRTDSVNIIANL